MPGTFPDAQQSFAASHQQPAQGNGNRRSMSAFSNDSQAEIVLAQLADVNLSPQTYAPDPYGMNNSSAATTQQVPQFQQLEMQHSSPQTGTDKKRVPRKPLPRDSPVIFQESSFASSSFPSKHDSRPDSGDGNFPTPEFISAPAIPLSPALKMLYDKRTGNGRRGSDDDDLNPSSHALEMGTKEALSVLAAVSVDHKRALDERAAQSQMEQQMRISEERRAQDRREGKPPVPPKIPHNITKEEWSVMSSTMQKSRPTVYP